MKKIFLLITVLLGVATANAVIIRVDKDATGLNNGNTWANAYEDLQDALAAAVSGDEIWVAEGIYKPTTTNNRDIAFEIIDGVELYGGFLGTETSRSQRDWAVNVTILSGAIGVNNDETDNTRHIIFVNGADVEGVLIDGFEIRKSYSEVFGAVYINDSEALLRHCSIYDNFSDGGSSAVTSSSSATTLDNCLIRDNETDDVIGSIIYGTHYFGDIGDELFVIECTIVQNITGSNGTTIGAGIGQPCYFYNSIIWNDGYVEIGGGMVSTIANCLLDGYQNAADPLFTNEAANDFTLQFLSPARNAGDNSFTQLNLDLNHNTRSFDGTVDIGCYENQTLSIYYVDLSASGLNNGSSWEEAYTDLHEALNNAIEGQQIWVADGTYFTSFTNNRNESFVLKNNVPVYGGFAGGETSLDDRNWFDNVSDLSGNIGSQFLATDNAYHVLFADDATGSFLIDGFSIHGGYANGAGVHEDSGGAALIEYSTGTFTMNNCFAFANHTDYTGGAVTTFANSVFLNTIFLGNESHIGGAIDWSYGTTIENCLFVDNIANIGIVNHNSAGTMDMTGCTFEGNEVNWEFYAVVEGANGEVANTVIWGNDLFDTSIGAIQGSGLDVHHCILQGEELSPVIEGVAVYYVNPLYTDAANFQYALQPASVGINTGDNSLVTQAYDVAGNARILLGTVDIGSLEASACSQPNDVCDDAIALVLDDAPVMGSTKCATGGDSPSNACAAVTGKTVWYSFEAPASGHVIVNADFILNVSTNFNLRLSLYSGTCTALTHVACVNATGSGGDEMLDVTSLTSGNTYYLRVDAPAGHEGLFMIDVDEVPADCPGDFDDNGAVNVGDLLIFNGAFGCPSSCGEPDLDGNGVVNVGDLLLFNSLFGTVCP